MMFRLGLHPAGWAEFRRFRAMLLSILTVLGWPSSASLCEGFDSLTGVIAGLFQYLLPPLLLPLFGFLLVIGTTIVIGLIYGAIQFFMLGLPMMVFAWLYTRERELIIEGQQKAGLENYIKVLRALGRLVLCVA